VRTDRSALALEYGAWQKRNAACPAWQDWCRREATGRAEGEASCQAERASRGDPSWTFPVERIVGPAAAAQAGTAAVRQPATAPQDRVTFPGNLLVYVGELRQYCIEARGKRADQAVCELIEAQTFFRRLLAALETGDVYRAAEQAAMCAQTVASGIACLHFPKADGRYLRDLHAAKKAREKGQRYLAMVAGFRRENTDAGLTGRKAVSEAIGRTLAAYCAEVGYEVDRERFRQYMRRWKLAARR
jgi:hypothetical protein